DQLEGVPSTRGQIAPGIPDDPHRVHLLSCCRGRCRHAFPAFRAEQWPPGYLPPAPPLFPGSSASSAVRGNAFQRRGRALCSAAFFCLENAIMDTSTLLMGSWPIRTHANRFYGTVK